MNMTVSLAGLVVLLVAAELLTGAPPRAHAAAGFLEIDAGQH